MYNNLDSFDEANSKLLHIINSSDDSESASNLGRGLRKKKAMYAFSISKC